MKRISSRENSGFRKLKLLAHSGRERRKTGRTLLDGAHLVQAYLDTGATPSLLVASESACERAEIAALLGRCAAAEQVLVFADPLFDEASPVDAPSGILAVIEVPPPPRPGPLSGSCVVLDAIQDPGNVGSILRSAAAAGIGDVALTEGSATAWSPRVLRAGMGAHFRLRLHERAVPERLLAEFPGTLIATSATDGVSLFRTDLRGPVAWLFGSEGAGLSDPLAAMAGLRVRIPMPGAGESLNVAAAAAVCLFEQVRQRPGGR